MAPKFLSQLQSLPKNQRVALGVGAAAATGFGLYSYRKRKGTPVPTGATAAPPAMTNGSLSSLLPSDFPGGFAVVPLGSSQDGANFGGPGGLTGPLDPGNTVGGPVATPPPVATPGGGGGSGPPTRPANTPVLVGGQPVPNLSGQVPAPVITPTSTTFSSYPQALPPPTQPVSFFNTYTGGYQTLQPGTPGDLGGNVWAALLANPYVSPSLKGQASNAFSGIQSV